MTLEPKTKGNERVNHVDNLKEYSRQRDQSAKTLMHGLFGIFKEEQRNWSGYRRVSLGQCDNEVRGRAGAQVLKAFTLREMKILSTLSRMIVYSLRKPTS